MVFEMFDLARPLMTAGIRVRHPDISETELRVRVFERAYGNDLRRAIVRGLRRAFAPRREILFNGVVQLTMALLCGANTVGLGRPGVESGTSGHRDLMVSVK